MTKITVDNVDKEIGALTEKQAEAVFSAYSSPLAGKGNGKALLHVFLTKGFSDWVGLAIIKQECSFANRANNKGIDERNVANPFSAHFTDPSKWPEGCKRNALLIPDKDGKYEPADSAVDKKCAASGYRLPTFAESANQSASILERATFKKYREAGGYKDEINGQLNDILRKIELIKK